jgi:bidirectional [NiFe] hydrogenase diaphorase subunit
VPQQISVRIDSQLCTATEGETILEVARANGHAIPTLCHFEGLSSPGSCRLCLVEVSGVGRLLPACTTPAQSGMSVIVNSESLAHNRLMALELLFIERNHVCAVCVSNGHCELQSMAQTLGLTHVDMPYNFPRLPVDMSHPR